MPSENKVYISAQIYLHIVATNFTSDITRIKILLAISSRNITWKFTQNLR
jgi:hypothetical protein